MGWWVVLISSLPTVLHSPTPRVELELYIRGSSTDTSIRVDIRTSGFLGATTRQHVLSLDGGATHLRIPLKFLHTGKRERGGGH